MRTLISKTLRGLVLSGGLALATLLAAGPAAALTADLVADTATLTMPDGTPVTMWGFALPGDTPFDFDPITGTGVPVLREVAGNGLTINLTNNLTVPTSVVIPGQKADSLIPTWTDTTSGPRTDQTQRVQSFTHETARDGTGSYTWPTLKAGTYLIQSGTQPGVQVPMGLYAVLIVDEVADTTAYLAQPAATPINYSQDLVLLFSEVDSQQHQAVAGGTYGTAAYPTTMAAGYEADYFLINGRPWGPDSSAFSAGTEGSTTMLRFLNAGIRDRVPVLQQDLLSVVAEDGKPFTSVGGDRQQYTRHSVELPPMKTVDATFSPTAAGYYPVSDRRLGLTNGNNGPGGMLAYLQVDPLVPATWTLTAAIDGASTGTGSLQMISAPGGIDLANFVGGGSDNSEILLAGTQVTLTGTPEPGTGSALTGWVVTPVTPGECADPYGDCVITMDADKIVTATFTTFANVTVLTPNGGENIPSGSGYTVRWGAPATAVNFTLAYSLGAGSPWQVIATGVTGNKYVWAVPDSVPNSGSIYVAVVGYDATGNQVGLVDVSDNAALRSSVALLTPSAIPDEILPIGVPYEIAWSTSLVSGNIASIGLWYQTAPGTPWQFITSLGSAATSYFWTVPNNPTLQAKVGVIFYDATGTPLHMDVSDNMFVIQ